MKKIRNMNELKLYKQKLKYRELLMEKELIGTSADLVDHFSDKLKDYAFDLGTRMVGFLFNKKKDRKANKQI